MLEMKYTGLKIVDKKLREWQKLSVREKLEEIGKEGVEALMEATPKRTGKTAASWKYEIREKEKSGWLELVWLNTNFNDGINIAIIIQTGHGTARGGYVRGIDYINPALKPLFETFGERLVGEVLWK